MIFLHPGYLYLATLALPLLALYLLKIKAKRHVTPALFLWQTVIDEQHSSALFKRFQSWLSMLLLLLALLAIVLAMARPVIRAEQQPLLLVIDNSASMATQHQGISRLEQARQLAAKIISDSNALCKITLATITNNQLTIIVPATRNLRRLNEALATIKPTMMPLKAPALQTLRHSRQLLPNSKIILISDGCFVSQDKISNVELLKVGQPADNIGIIAFDTVRLPGTEKTVGIYFQLASSCKETVKTALIISKQYPDKIVKVYPLTVIPGLNPPETLRIKIAAAGRWFARIDRRDDFATDNMAISYISPRISRKISVGNGDSSAFLALCITAFRNGNKKLRLTNSHSDLVVTSGQLPSPYQAGKFIIFNPNGQSVLWKIGNTGTMTGLAETVLPRHPAVRFVQLDGNSFSGIKDITPPAGAVVICRTINQVPLIYKISHQGQEGYIINFDPVKSGFFFDINFPIMLKAMLDDLLGTTKNSLSVYHTGDHIPAAPTADEQFSFSSPQLPDKWQKLSATESITRIMDKCGFYQRRHGKKRELYAAALLSSNDSLPSQHPASDTFRPGPRGLALHNYLLILALLLITVESLLYHRGKV